MEDLAQLGSGAKDEARRPNFEKPCRGTLAEFKKEGEGGQRSDGLREQKIFLVFRRGKEGSCM